MLFWRFNPFIQAEIYTPQRCAAVREVFYKLFSKLCLILVHGPFRKMSKKVFNIYIIKFMFLGHIFKHALKT